MRSLFVLLSVALGGVAMLAVAEVVVRGTAPPPRAQVVRERAPGRPGMNVVVRHGQPTWSMPGSEERRNEDCTTPDTVDVAMFGSSITFGTSVEAHEAMSARLQALLDAREPGRWCVHNYAQAAYTGWNKLAEARDVLPRLRPEVVVWELWGNDPGRYQRIAGAWYNLDGFRLDEGLPWVLPLPAGPHRLLFERSLLYQYGTLTLSPLEEGGPGARWARYAVDFLPEFEALLRDHPTRLVVVAAAPFNQPFGKTAARPSEAERAMSPWLRAHDVPLVRMAEELVGHAPADVGLDTCCHYNPAGHEIAARILLPHVLARAEGEPTAVRRAPSRGQRP